MSAGAGRRTTEVAVGVLIDSGGRVLLSDRPADKPYGGYWEFPGGKIEPGESVAQALRRELHEELGVQIGRPLPWVTFEFDYPHAYVRLHFCRIWEWGDEVTAREGQRWDFFDLDASPPAPLLPAAVPALRWLRLPPALHLQADGRICAAPESLPDDSQIPLRALSVEQLRAAALAAAHNGGDGAHGAGDRWIGAWIESDADLSLAANAGMDFALARGNAPAASAPLPLYVPRHSWRALRTGEALGCAHGPLDVERTGA